MEEKNVLEHIQVTHKLHTNLVWNIKNISGGETRMIRHSSLHLRRWQKPQRALLVLRSPQITRICKLF